jgi:hypothetical protein
VSQDVDREVAIAFAHVSEGFCPLCHVRLVAHDDRACCPCGGCSYRVSTDRLEMLSACDQHPACECEHWEAVWRARGVRRREI